MSAPAVPVPEIQPEGNGYTATCPNPGCGWLRWSRSMPYARARLDDHKKTCKKGATP